MDSNICTFIHDPVNFNHREYVLKPARNYGAKIFEGDFLYVIKGVFVVLTLLVHMSIYDPIC